MRRNEEGMRAQQQPKKRRGDTPLKVVADPTSLVLLIDWECGEQLAERKQEGDWGNHQVGSMNYGPLSNISYLG